VHPVTHESKVFQSDPPEDFVCALASLGLSYNSASGP
jgi:hypothetical protein